MPLHLCNTSDTIFYQFIHFLYNSVVALIHLSKINKISYTFINKWIISISFACFSVNLEV